MTAAGWAVRGTTSACPGTSYGTFEWKQSDDVSGKLGYCMPFERLQTSYRMLKRLSMLNLMVD